MASLYLLDTNILLAAMRGHPEVRRRLEVEQISAIRLSSIVLGELEFDAEKSAYGDRNRGRLAALTQRLPLVSIDHDAIRHYARIRALLERQGTPIGANDTWISAQALAINAVFVTDNEREFSRVPGLTVENWLAGSTS